MIFKTQVIGTLSHSELVAEAEEEGKTVMECFPGSEMAEEYRKLAEVIYELSKDHKNRGGMEMLKKAGESTGLEFNSPAHGTGILSIQECFFRKRSRSMSVQITVCGELF